MRATIWAGAAGVIALCGMMAAGQESPNVLLTLEGHYGGVTAITFNGKGDQIATGSGNGLVRIWQLRAGETVAELRKPIARLDEFKGISITGLTFSPDGSVLSASGKGKVGLWSPVELRVPRPEPTPGSSKSAPKYDEYKSYRWLGFNGVEADANYSDSAITGDGKEIYFTRRHHGIGLPGRVLRFDKSRDLTDERPGPKYFDPRAVACVSDPESGVAAVYGTIDDKGTSAIVIYGFGEVKIITRGVPPLPTQHTGPAGKKIHPRITFSTDGKWLAAYSGTLAVWPVPGSHIIGGEPGTLDNVYAAAIGPRNLLATVAPPDELHTAIIDLWRLEIQSKRYGLLGNHWTKQVVEAKKVKSYETKLKDVSCLAFSPDGATLAVGGSTDGVVQLWKIDE